MNELPYFSNPSFGFCNTPFGVCCIAYSVDGICSLTFSENRESALYELERRFPDVTFTQNDETVKRYAYQIFELKQQMQLHPIGTPFQLAIWEALQRIPIGTTTTYAQIAAAIGRSKAVRAVGTAIGANPIAFLIPCHRVIRTDGTLGGFRWGLDCKIKILDWEKSKNSAQDKI